MLFNSLEFLFFFPVITLIYFLLPHKFRWLHLLLASCIFYMAFIPVYILILFFTIIIDYFAGILIDNAEGKRRKAFLFISIVANVGVLCVFKYYNFFIENVNALLPAANIHSQLPFLKILLPIGLSFHTFQAMSYTIEVYRKKQKPETHFGIYALYVMFYPQLVAGPIERPQNLLPQFRMKHEFNTERVISGLRMMMWGLFKKVVIADNLSEFVNSIYARPENFSGLPLILATLFFTIQIYCDFSGYSDVAIGSARVMGFNLMTNFRIPYLSRSISEFWKRWHISLSTWFKDYLYISLGGNRVSDFRRYANLFIVFLVSGFWHGANWTFIIWGALHGTYLICGLLTQSARKKFNELSGLIKFPMVLRLFDIGFVFCLVSFAWIFFRANTMHDAIYVIRHLFSGTYSDIDGMMKHGWPAISDFISGKKLIGLIFLIGVMEWVHRLQSEKLVGVYLAKIPPIGRWSIYYFIIAMIIINGQTLRQQFIYFQF